ncbi:FecR family protein [Nitrospina watsonii]|uniref:DUF4880 domain-containing protein n=1 Tax=Nitrospina watsonii TaxID=1323948 RepID=A0ABM9HF71_9BACT|nr:FecR family protein [Nitrospina watsonii]CAI2718818.1 conserved protein of unknown function [Nitrospina watsonii]
MKEPKTRQEIESRAAWWIVRMRSPDFSPNEREELMAWRRHPDHEKAFRLALDTWGQLGKAAQAPRRKTTATRQPNLHATLQTPPARSPAVNGWAHAGSRSGKKAGWLGYAAAAALLLVAMWPGLQAANPFPMDRADHRTSYGEIRAVTLPDGSRVRLNTRTVIALRFSDSERRVELLEGEADFTVVAEPDRKRPFIVEAGQGQARALGTRFVVRRVGESLQFTALHHSIEVTTPSVDAKEPERVVLHPGEVVHVDPMAHLSPVEKPSQREIVPWERGRLVFDRVPFSQVIDEINRYRVERIVITNDDLAKRRVSAVFHLDDLDHVIDMAAEELQATVVPVPPYYTLLY